MAKIIRKATKSFGRHAASIAVVSCLALSGVYSTANAAGLGKIVVFSALGQPLRAEIEVAASREELVDMKAQLASPDVFKQAGLDYATTLLGINFSIDRRSNGKAVIKLNSDKPINDPFIDLLLELNWSTGRLVREYTFLLDPPDMMVKGSVPVAPSQAKPAASRSASASSPVAGIDDEVRNKAVARVRARDADTQQPSTQASERSGSREVRRGDTLHRIAVETKHEGVSLEQMLVGLLRANESAFDGGNMNRLKAGKILTVPDKSTIDSVPSAEARKIVIAQSADWNAYRNKLAGVAAKAPASEDESKQESAGKITAKVEDKAAPAETPKDQLKVSKTDSGDGKLAAPQTDEDLIAKEKALKEANERLSILEKNLADLQKLVELKNQNLAELQKQAQVGQVQSEANPADVPKPTAPETPPDATEPLAVAPAPAVPAVEQAAEPPVKAEEVKPEPKKPVDAPKPKPVIPPPPPEEPTFVEELLENPLPLAGAGGILALIAAYFVARRRRVGKEEVPLNLGSTLTPSSTSLTGNSVFRSTGGQSVDTSQTPAQTDFSQAGPGSIDTDEVDPVAEADVYMAYGRDAQAEEILLEAKQKDPKRLAIHLKLLEIYSNRKDLKQFETLATDLYSETGGVGADWEKAAAMGLELDPENPLFGAKEHAAPKAAFDADATVIVPSLLASSTVTMPGALSQLAVEASPEAEAEPVAVEAPAPVADLASLDFDLGFGDAQPSEAKEEQRSAEFIAPEVSEPVVEQGPLDFDLGADSLAVEAEPASSIGSEVAVGSDIGLDFNFPEMESTSPAMSQSIADLDTGSEAVDEVAREVIPAHQQVSESGSSVAVEDDGVEFDVSLTESTFLGRSVPDTSPFDMASIDLDLGVPDIPAAESGEVSESLPEIQEDDFESLQVATAVNPDFETEQTETIVSPNFAPAPEPDLLPEQDFSMAQLETQLNQASPFDLSASAGDDFVTAQEETVVNPQFGENEDDLLPEFELSANEEVATKLDLAKAYEEMGDFEGASELLQEVLKEGDAVQKEKAKAILAKIST